MKICLVHEEYPEETNFGGIATYQKNLAEELVRQGNDVYVICRGLNKSQYYVENGVKVYRIYGKKYKNQLKEYIYYRKKVSKLLKYLQGKKLIDLIEVPDWGAETIFFEKYRKIPLIVRLHTPLKIWLKYNKNNFGKVTDTLLKWEEKIMLSADRITCCSHALKNLILKEFNIKSNILVNPNPANTFKFYRNDLIVKEERLVFVGSLEERKGVVVLAQALNIFFKKYPNVKIDFIGKDTLRNSSNCSTVELIKNIVKKKYRDNLNFIGQIPNSNLNYYFNRALVGVFPSLFDNFPYVVLESMATGLYIIGSENSGMVEMINDNDYIYHTGDYIDLANKIDFAYKEALENKINQSNIDRVINSYSSEQVCKDILEDYNNIIKNYYKTDISKEELSDVLKFVKDEKIISFKKAKSGVANVVYIVKTNLNTYVIKKYLYNYNFVLSNKLYDIYEKNFLNVVRPINKEVIHYKNFNYNVFNYINSDKSLKNLDIDFFKKLICVKRKSLNSLDFTSEIVKNKIDKYVDFLKNVDILNLKMSVNELYYVINIYEEISGSEFINNKVINHGDLSRSNILCKNKEYYVIDFDETCLANELYDFSVIVVKFLQENGVLNYEKYNKLVNSIDRTFKLDKSCYITSIKFYLCKILIEKFYLYQLEKIDLFDKTQLKDDYRIYLKLLKNIDSM